LNGENEHTAKGREAHKWREYEGFRKEFELANGDRVDFINQVTRQIIELKPGNPAKAADYLRQLQRYLDQLNKQFPGTPWTGRIEYY
jgi:hypothetical protein